MSISWPRWITLLLFGLTLAHAASDVSVPRVEFRLKHGDDPRWAARDWDDHDWEIVGETDGRIRPAQDIIPARAGIFWLRYRVMRTDQPEWGLNVPSYLWPADKPGAPVNSVFLPGTLTYEFYWDGRLIGRSGKVGMNRDAEEAGPIDNLMLIPDTLLGPGPHVVAMRISTYHYNFSADRFRIAPCLGNYEERLSYEAHQSIVPLIGASGAALVGLICVVLFAFVDRRRSLVICGSLGFATALFFALIAWRWLHADPYPWLRYRYDAMLATMALIGVLMIWLLIEQFAIPRRSWWLLGALVIVALIWSGSAYQQVKTIWLGRAMLGYALLPASWAVWKRRPGAWLAVIGVVIGLGSVQQATDMRSVISPTSFLFFGALVIMLLGVLSFEIRADRQQAREAQLAAARLEAELLKKNLQPHFLLNTLAVLTEIVEQDPPRAVKLIDDLADEFRSVARVASEKLIPLAQELELCRAHLRVMSVRTGQAWQLDAAGVDETIAVPPAVLLTLIENGFTHQRGAEGSTVFRLELEQTIEGTNRLTFFSPGEVQVETKRSTSGTGLLYVKARLEESFPGRWSLQSEPVAGGWSSTIMIEPLKKGSLV